MSGEPERSRTELAVAERRVALDEDPAAPPSRFRRGLYRVAAVLLIGFGRALFRVKVEGREHIPATGPYILAPVHRSNLDFALMLNCVGTRLPRLRFLAKDTLWKGAWGRLWNALGAFPVHRGTPDRAALDTCIRILDAGESLVIFPEGTRQTGEVVQELFDGVAYIQARAGVPIVPVGIGGSEAAMPKGAKFIRPTRVIIRIGTPMDPPARNERGRVPRSAVRAQTEALHRVLQELFDGVRAEVDA